jgi:hypothetical protein
MKKELKDEWTPQAGEWVEVLDYGAWLKDPRVFVCEWKNVFYYVQSPSDIFGFEQNYSRFNGGCRLSSPHC